MVRLPFELVQAAIEPDSPVSDLDLVHFLNSAVTKADRYRPMLVAVQSSEAQQQIERMLDSGAFAMHIGGYTVDRRRYWLMVDTAQQDSVITSIGEALARYRHSIYCVHSKLYTHDQLGVVLRLFARLHEARPAQGVCSELTTALAWLNMSGMAPEDTRQLLDLIGGPIWADPVLKRTMEAVLSADLNLAQAARRLNTHRNTLSYRLRRIQAQTGIDLTNFHQAKCLFFCMMQRMISE